MKRVICTLVAFLIVQTGVRSADISEVPLWDGETVDNRTHGDDRLTNRLGGGTVGGTRLVISHTTTTVHSGQGAFRLAASIPLGSYGFSGISMTGFGPNASYIDTRDLTRFQNITFWLKNETGAPFTFALEIKDYRDSNSHRARRDFTITSGSSWQEKTALFPLTPANGWAITGSPDLSRTKLVVFVIESTAGSAVNGSVFIDDLFLRESGGVLDSATAPIDHLVGRLAERQFAGLWGSRDRATGLLPLNSSLADIVALNSTAGLIKILPRAVAEGWVSQSDADAYVALVIASLHTAVDSAAADYGAGFLPPRYMDRVSLETAYGKEESSADAAFVFLALYQYRETLAAPAALRNEIDALLNRFDFASFSSPQGWKLAFKHDDGSFTAGTYDGYSGEIYVISLAAHLADSNHVNIATHFHSGVNRVNAFLVDSNRTHLVHSSADFRAAFLQWLFPLFVDVTGRGRDTYPEASLARNPLYNAILYQTEVHAKLSSVGRGDLLQPDAADDGTGATYEQFSLYNDFGQPELLMPWSVGFSFLTEPAVAEAALRTILSKGLHGPLGLQDSVRWFTGQTDPASSPARIDFWNVALCEMALLQYAYSDNRFLSAVPDVASALDSLYFATNLRIDWDADNTLITLLSERGASYSVQFTDSLTAPSWEVLQTLHGTGEDVTAEDSDSSVAYRFYRALIE